MLSIVNEVDPLIFQCVCFVWDTNICFYKNWYQSGLQFRICIACFVSFGIKDSNFMMLEDFTIKFLHGYWNYLLIKTDIDVMMLFKFDVKCVRLNFKAIASMEFSFWSQTLSIMFIRWQFVHENRWKLFGENFGKFNFMSFDRSRIPFDRSNRNQESIKSTRDFMMNFFKFSIDREFLLIDQKGIKSWSSHLESLLNFLHNFDRSRDTFDWSKDVNFEFSLSVFTSKSARLCVMRLHMISN